MAKEMFCEFCALQFGNDTVFKLHLKLVHNIIKEDEEMTLVKPKERLTLITHNQHLLPSQILELTPESQENEHFNPVPSDLVSDNQILSNLLGQQNSKNDNCASNSKHPKAISGMETGFFKESSINTSKPSTSKAVSSNGSLFGVDSTQNQKVFSQSFKSAPTDRFNKHPKARSGTEIKESPIITSKLKMSKENQIKDSLTEEVCSKKKHK